VPVELIAQARLAARNGVGIDTVLRRYFGGYVLLGEFLAQEAAAADVPSVTLKRLMHSQATAFDRLLAVVSEEHAREAKTPPVSSGRLRLRRVQRLLAGEPVDVSGLPYGFDANHLGLVAVGDGAEAVAQELASVAGRSLLAVRPERDTVWAWLEGRHPLPSSELHEIATARGSTGVRIAIGEPASGLAGWRLTHRQAAAALLIAVRGPEPAVRYADVALLAAVLQDELLATSLWWLYLEPLERERDGGGIARETLRAYFAAERNVSAASVSLGVSRPTVKSRLRAIEERIGTPVHLCAAEIEVALRLQELRPPAVTGVAK